MWSGTAPFHKHGQKGQEAAGQQDPQGLPGDERLHAPGAAFTGNPDRLGIPYSLLGFSPQFMMSDLPTTTRDQAEECLEAAKEAGLRRVRIGNAHLLA
jgi:pyruvate formate lyase activating enzyme